MTTIIHQIDDMRVRITRRDNHEIEHITIEQRDDIVVMSKADIRAIAELLVMNDICDGSSDIVRR